MTPERIRIKVAEAMGWKHPEYGYMQNAWRESNGSWHFGSNVLDDLNACAEFEGALTDAEQMRYVRYLVDSDGHYDRVMKMDPTRTDEREGFIENHLHGLGWDEAFCFCVQASPLQRCEAYLRVKGLWEESPVPDKQPLSPTADTHAANKAANHRTGCGDNA